VTGTHLSRILR
jgi:hypothetical protein